MKTSTHSSISLSVMLTTHGKLYAMPMLWCICLLILYYNLIISNKRLQIYIFLIFVCFILNSFLGIAHLKKNDRLFGLWQPQPL